MTPARTIAKLRRQLAAALARAERAETAWQRDPELWPHHVKGYSCRRVIEAAARKHGRALGPVFRALLVDRLVATARSMALAWGVPFESVVIHSAPDGHTEIRGPGERRVVLRYATTPLGRAIVDTATRDGALSALRQIADGLDELAPQLRGDAGVLLAMTVRSIAEELARGGPRAV